MTIEIPADEITRRQSQLVTDLFRSGSLIDPAWQRVFSKVQRHTFIPDTVWRRNEDGMFEPFSRHESQEEWLNSIYSDVSIVTQVDDGRPVTLGEHPTSSASQPSLVAEMLDRLSVSDGQAVLEIGTGTGYNAALLCERLGSKNVTTLEVDAVLGGLAYDFLTQGGYHPTILIGDGSYGFPDNAPYDRIISTCAVQSIPNEWVRQTRTGGLILAPRANAYFNEGLLLLSVHGDGFASGPFVGSAQFMHLRQQRISWRGVSDTVHHEGEQQVSATRLDPRYLVEINHDMLVALGIQLPSIQYIIAHAQDESQEFTIWFADLTDGSWASVDYVPGQTEFEVCQYGQRRVWDDVEAAYRWWAAAGKPHAGRFHLNVTPHEQYYSLDHPHGKRWQCEQV